MAGTSDHTDEQKAKYVQIAVTKGRQAAGDAAGVSTTTISHWAKQQGVTLTAGKKAAPRKRRKKAKQVANGKTNGNVGMPATSAGLDRLHADLSKALEGVTVMREAFRRVFG